MSRRSEPRTRQRRGSKNRTAAPPPKRPNDIAELWDVQAIEPDGLFINSRGTYMRVIECQHVPNIISAQDSVIARIRDGWAELCTAIPNNQTLSFYAQQDPIAIGEALEMDEQRVDDAIADDVAAGHPDLGTARRRLFQSQRQTVVYAAGGEQPAVRTRFWVAVPFSPDADTPRERAEDLVAPFRPSSDVAVKMTWERHQRAAIDSMRYAKAVAGHLTGMGIDAHIMGPVEILAEGWDRLHPGALELPDIAAFADVADVVKWTDPEAARAHRQRIVDAVTAGDEPCGIDDRDPRWLRHADGTLEEVIHLATPPAMTTVWWLSLLLGVPLPCTVAVHISVGDRAQTRTRYRIRWRRQEAAASHKERRSGILGHEEVQALKESAQLDADMSTTQRSTVYQVAIYASYRQPAGDAEDLDERLTALAKEFGSLTDAKVMRGRFVNRRGLVATMPIGQDPLKARRRYAHRNIGDCVPLGTDACGSPDGLMLGFSDPGGTLERLDPYDILNTTHVSLVIAPSGGGKTVTMNALLARGVAQGMSGYIIDRSSTEDETGGGRSQGHYAFLLSLVPGSRTVQVGGGRDQDIICPWDVPDVANVPKAKIEMLLALHALLIGSPGASGGDRQLDSLERGLLTRAITQVYRSCAGDDTLRPCESQLVAELRAIGEEGVAVAGADANAVLSTVAGLLAKLHPFTAGEPYEYIADLETTILNDAPLTLFDIAGSSEELLPAQILTIIEYVKHQVETARARSINAGNIDVNSWAGRQFLLVEEGWKITASRASGEWLNEYARRSRHMSLWLIMVTQHYKDLDTEQGRALAENAQIKLHLPNISENDLAYARDIVGLTDRDVEEIRGLRIRKGVYSTTYVVSPRGRGRVRMMLGPLEFWTCSNDPRRDQPLKILALKESDSPDATASAIAWSALRKLASPRWHAEVRERQQHEA